MTLLKRIKMQMQHPLLSLQQSQLQKLSQNLQLNRLSQPKKELLVSHLIRRKQRRTVVDAADIRR